MAPPASEVSDRDVLAEQAVTSCGCTGPWQNEANHGSRFKFSEMPDVMYGDNNIMRVGDDSNFM